MLEKVVKWAGLALGVGVGGYALTDWPLVLATGVTAQARRADGAVSNNRSGVPR